MSASSPLEIKLDLPIVPVTTITPRFLELSPSERTLLHSSLSNLDPSESYHYPPCALRSRMSKFFHHYFEIKPSLFPHGGRGVFLKKNRTLPAKTLIGWYGGILRPPQAGDSDNHYLFGNSDLFRTDPTSCHSNPDLTYLSRINENIFHSLTDEGMASQESDLPDVNNCKFINTKGSLYTGAVATTRRIHGGEELTLFLGQAYTSSWEDYYSHLIEHSWDCFSTLLRTHVPSLHSSLTPSFKREHRPIMLAHVQSTAGSSSPLPTEEHSLRKYLLHCLHNDHFRNDQHSSFNDNNETNSFFGSKHMF